ncbi:MAG: hypothetical protein J6U97_01415 [Bacteroidaceae bacterium]|nr:hypothetical protein [Bacteroidaceae bacterium]
MCKLKYSLTVVEVAEDNYNIVLNGSVHTGLSKHTMLSFLGDFFAAEFEEQEEH